MDAIWYKTSAFQHKRTLIEKRVYDIPVYQLTVSISAIYLLPTILHSIENSTWNHIYIYSVSIGLLQIHFYISDIAQCT